MSQFIVCVASDQHFPLSLVVRSPQQDERLAAIAKELFHVSLNRVCVPVTFDGETPNTLFDDAFSRVHAGERLTSTKLWEMLEVIRHHCTALAMWWGDDYKDLPVATEPHHFESLVEDCLASSIGDVYVMWLAQSRNAGV